MKVPRTARTVQGLDPAKTTKGKTISNSNVTSNLVTRLRNGVESGLVELERQFATESIRTIRLRNDLSRYTIGSPSWVIESEAGMWSTVILGKGHPARTAEPGDYYEFRTEEGDLMKQTFVGLFDMVATIADPVDGARITLMAAHTPATDTDSPAIAA